MDNDAQKKHADKIRAERAIMGFTGLSRSQIRDQLHLVGRLFQARIQDRQVAVQPFVPETPKLPEVNLQQFNPKPFTLTEVGVPNSSNNSMGLQLPPPPETGTYALISTDGVLSWIAVTTCS